MKLTLEVYVDNIAGPMHSPAAIADEVVDIIAERLFHVGLTEYRVDDVKLIHADYEVGE